jgi:elongation factor G
MRDMLKESAMSVLQPVMQVEVSVPEQFFGNILSDISNYRRGNIQRVEDGSNAKEKIVSAEVPLRAMMGYSTAVRSISQGTASFTMDFLRYGDLPENEIEALHKEYRGF